MRWALISYTLWGFFPIYWKALSSFSSLEILAHRVFWSFVFYIACLIFLRIKIPTQLDRNMIVAAILISFNWLLYIYAVNFGQVLQGSLAYFLTPFLNMLLGYFIFAEKFSMKHKISIAMALVGVFFQFERAVQFPWLAVGMALSFSLYGAIKKKTPLSSLQSGYLETLVVAPISLVFLIFFRAKAVPDANALDWLLLVGSGVVTGCRSWVLPKLASK